MLCSAIKLNDRRHVEKDDVKRCKKKHTLEENFFMKSDYYHSYAFRWDKPKRSHNCEEIHYLSIKNLSPPEDIHAFNTGSSTDRWSKKRPRLRTAKLKDSIKKNTKNDETSRTIEDFDASELLDQLPEETDETSNPNLSKNDEESDIDSDIKQLFERITTNENEEAHVREHRRKGKSGKKSKKKTKTIKFSLSKPPTPQTVQVIRVDITSNYSYEEIIETATPDQSEDKKDCSRGCGKRIRSGKLGNLSRNNSELESDARNKEMSILCRKVVFNHRNGITRKQ